MDLKYHRISYRLPLTRAIRGSICCGVFRKVLFAREVFLSVVFAIIECATNKGIATLRSM